MDRNYGAGVGAGTGGASAGGGGLEKIVTLDRLVELRERARREGRAVVQCHGCFDIVHPGHVRHLRQARQHGDVLVVSITGDTGYAKRDGTPLIPDHLRAENLAALDCVDLVYVDPSATALELLRAVRPDVYVKGQEYQTNHDPRFEAERAAVEAGGGRVVFSSGDVVFSSTALIRALERSADPYHARLSGLLGRSDMEWPALWGVMGRARGARVLVVGEVIVDEYVLCDQPEVASEGPVMTLRPLERRSYDGGAAIIARHLAAMGARPVLLTGLPESAAAEAMRRRLGAEGVEVRSVRTEVPIAEKQRYLVGAQKVMKVNNLRPIVLDAARADELRDAAAGLASECGGAIIADFGNGLLPGPSLEALCHAVRPRVPLMVGDVSGRRGSLLAMRGVDVLCPSESEAREAVRLHEESIPAVAWGLLRATGARAALITMGGEGLIAFEPIGGGAAEGPVAPGGDGHRTRLRAEHVPALCGYPVDPLGCGDALLAALTVGLVGGASLVQAAFLGSLAAACQAQRLGNTPVSWGDVRAAHGRLVGARLAVGQSDVSPGAWRVPAAALGAGAGVGVGVGVGVAS
ncbi:MAG: hypothetical protein C0468_06640 [Planctomyces sp.]|nr:hypothetical protein [Planctomyces sp.]